MNADNERTTIEVKRKTKDKIAALGTTADSYDDVVNRLAEFWIRYKDVVDQRK